MLDALFEQFDNLVVLDTETTGIDCKRDEIIELAALRIVKDGTACRMEEEISVSCDCKFDWYYGTDALGTGTAEGGGLPPVCSLVGSSQDSVGGL